MFAHGYYPDVLFPLALAGGALIFAIVLIIFVLVLAYTAYGKHGQNIGAHSTTSQSAPGAGRKAGLQDPDGDDAEQTFGDHGGR